MKRQELLETYEHAPVCSTAGLLTQAGRDKTTFQPELDKTAFIPLYIKDEKLPFFRKMEYYPDDSKRPPDHLNLWTGFRVERMTGEYVPDENGADELEAFVRDCISDGHDGCYNFLMDWLAHMFLYPTERAPSPVLVAKMGSGKGTFADLLRALLDKRAQGKVFETAEPENTVWGKFNPLMQHAFVVFLDEVDGSNLFGAANKVKNIQMAGVLTINPKGINPFVIKALHRYLWACNNIDNAIQMQKGERRNVPIRCSDAFIPRKEYFVRIRERFGDDSVLRTFHARLLKRNPPKRWNPEDLPVSEYAENLKEASTDLLTQWLRWLVLQDHGNLVFDYRLEQKDHLRPVIDDSNVIITTTQLFWTLQDFTLEMQMAKHIEGLNPIKLGCRLSNRRIPGVTKDNSKFKGYAGFQIDMATLKASI